MVVPYSATVKPLTIPPLISRLMTNSHWPVWFRHQLSRRDPAPVFCLLVLRQLRTERRTRHLIGPQFARPAPAHDWSTGIDLDTTVSGSLPVRRQNCCPNAPERKIESSQIENRKSIPISN